MARRGARRRLHHGVLEPEGDGMKMLKREIVDSGWRWCSFGDLHPLDCDGRKGNSGNLYSQVLIKVGLPKHLAYDIIIWYLCLVGAQHGLARLADHEWN